MPKVGSLCAIAKALRSGRVGRVTLMAGAGISTPSGLPDFRWVLGDESYFLTWRNGFCVPINKTPGSGLYDNLEKYNLPFPEAVFDINYFSRNPEPFFHLAKRLYPGLYPPNVCHWLGRILQDKNLLLRFYTQNIDGIESLAGVMKERLVEAHGSFASATCQGCFQKYPASHLKAAIFNDEVPLCTKCQHTIKPDIVFFGEMLPERFMLHLVDMPVSDLLIVMGTSLEVYPFAGIANYVRKSVPRLLINREVVGTFSEDPRENDHVFQGDVVEGVSELIRLCHWEKHLEILQNQYKQSAAESLCKEKK